MFNHLVLGASNLEQSRRFYDAFLGALGVAPGAVGKDSYRYLHDGDTLVIKVPINGQPASAANGGTLGFKASSEQQAKAAHDAGVAAGGTTCEDPPGLRPNGMYLAYLRDPVGNKLCAVYRPAKA